MNPFELFEAVGELDDDILTDAQALLDAPAKRPRSRLKWGALAACLAAAACAVRVGGRPDTQAPPLATPSAVATGAVTDRPAEEPEALDRPPADMSFNVLTEEPDTGLAAMFDLSADDFVPMTRAELLEYYGAALPIEEIMPALSATGPEEGDGFGRGIYRNGSRGAYFDTNTFSFESPDGVCGVYVTLDKVFCYPTATWSLPGESLQFTAIRGRELALFLYTDGEGNRYFHAEFEQNGADYRVCGKNICEQEFAAVLTALLEERENPSPGEPRAVTGTVTAGIARRTATSTGPDGRVTTQVSYAGPLGLRPDEGSEFGSLQVELTPEQAERLASLSPGDRVTVTFTGEPATIGTVWTQQLIQLEKAEG